MLKRTSTQEKKKKKKAEIDRKKLILSQIIEKELKENNQQPSPQGTIMPNNLS